MAEKKPLELVRERYNDASMYWSPIYTKFEELEDMYWGKLNYDNPGDQAWKSRAVDNIAFEAVERMQSHLLAGDPKGRFVPVEPKDDYGAMVNQALFDFQWNYPGQDMNKKLRIMGLQTGVFGIGFGLLDWKYEERTRKKIEYGEMEQTETEETYVHCDQPWFRPLYIYDCYPDPSATCIDDMEWFMYEEYVTLGELKERNKGKFKPYQNLGKLEDKLKETEATQNEHRTNLELFRGASSTVKKNRILIRTMLTRDSRISYAPDVNILIEDGDNPYWHGDLPVHMIVDYSYPNQLFGRGEIDPIRTMQKALNNILNQRLDNVKLILNTGFKAKANSKYMSTWKMRPGWIALVDEMDELQPFNVPDVTSQTFLETTNYFKDSTYRVLGYTDFLTRNETEGDKTATEIRASVGEQNARMKDKEKNIDSFLQRLANQWLALNQQFMTNQKVIRIVGADAQKMIAQKTEEKQMQQTEQGMMANPDVPQMMLEPENPYKQGDGLGYLEVYPNDLAGRYDYMIETGSLSEVDPAQEAQSLMMAITTLRDNEDKLMATDNIKVNYQPLMEKLLRQLGVKNIDQVFEAMSEQEITMRQQQMMPQMGAPRRLPPANIQ